MPTSLFLVHFVGIAAACVRMLIGAFSVIYLLEHGVSLAQVGLLKSFQAAVIVFIDIPLSYISDRYSRKLSIALSILCSAIWLILTGISESFSLFLVAEFFNALSLGLISGTFSAYLYDVSQKEKPGEMAAKILAAYQKNQFLFMGIFSLFGAYLYSLEARMAWFVAGALMLGVLVISIFLPKDSKNPTPAPMSVRNLFAGVWALFSTSEVKRSLVFVILGYGLFLQSLIQFWQPLVTYFPPGFSKATVLGATFFAILMAQSISGKAIQALHGSLNLERLAFAATMLSFLLMCLSQVYNVFSVFSLVTSFFSLSMLASLGTAAVVQNSPAEYRSTYLSTLSTLGKLLMLITMPLVAFSIEQSGLWFFAVLMFGCMFSRRVIFPNSIPSIAAN